MAERREDMRAADADRQFVAERLQSALNEGRLSLAEYDERLQQAYAARTYGELDHILDDLPTVVPPEHAQVAPSQVGTPAAAPTGRRGMPPWLLMTWGSWFSSSLICTVIWMLTGMGYPWPLWVAGPWGAVLLGRTVMAYASGDPHGYAAAEQERERRRKRDRWEREQQRRADRWDRRRRY